MKKILCDKDGKFLSVHDGDCILAELEDGNYLTHEDGTIVIYKETDFEPLLGNIYFHAYYKNGVFFLSKTILFFMIMSVDTDSLQKKKKNICTKFFLKTTYTMTRKKNALKRFAGVLRRTACIITLISVALTFT